MIVQLINNNITLWPNIFPSDLLWPIVYYVALDYIRLEYYKICATELECNNKEYHLSNIISVLPKLK